MKANNKFLLGLLTLVILCACARGFQRIPVKSSVPTEGLAYEKVKDSTLGVLGWQGDARVVGTGFFVARDKIATNIHLLAGVDPVSVHVRVSNGTRSIRGVTAFDVENNLVILEITGEGVPLPIGDSDAVKIGDSISGIDTFVRRYGFKDPHGTVLGVRSTDKWFSTTLHPDPTVSGGPVLNSKNEVIGIEVMEGEFGYAIPSNALKMLLDKMDKVEPLTQWQQRDVIRVYSYVEQAKREFGDGDHDSMIEMLTEAIKLNPKFATAYVGRGEKKLSLGELVSGEGNVVGAQRYYRSAIGDFDSALQLNSESAAAYKNRALTKRLLADAEIDAGNLKEAQRYYDEAIADYAQVIKRVPSDAASYAGRGTARKNLGKSESETGNAAAQKHYHAAIDDYTQAIKRKPDYAEAYHNRGLAKAHLRQQEEALLDFKKAETLIKGTQAAVRIEGRFGAASGFFVALDKIATNIHVISQPRAFFIKSPDNQTTWRVEGVAAFDVKNDLAILKVTGEGTPALLGDSDAVRIGEPVIAFGYSGGKYKVTEGIIRSVRNSDKRLRIEIDTTGGSSGSAILNGEGQVIGVDVSGYPSYSYAIPSNALKALLARSEPTEPLAQWQQRKKISAYHYCTSANHKYRAKRYEDAITDLDKALQLNPEFILAYNGRASTKIRHGAAEAELGNREKAQRLYQDAIEDLNEAIKLNPKHADAYYMRAAARIEFGRSEADRGDAEKAQRLYEMAIQDCTQVTKLEPQGFLAYDSRGIAKSYFAAFKANRGHTTEAQQLHAAAIEDFSQAIQLAPAYPLAYNHRGHAKCFFGKFKVTQGDIVSAEALYVSAVQDCAQAITIDPEYANAYNNRGWAKYLLGKSKTAAGNIEEARKLYEAAHIDADKSIQLDSDNAYAYLNRGTIKAALGHPEEAIVDFDSVIEINPKHAKAYYERSLAKKALGQHEAAKTDFKKAKALDPNVDRDDRK